MFKNLYLKTLYSLRWQVFGWSLAVIFVGFITMAMFNSFDSGGMKEILSTVPDSMKSLIGSLDKFTTVPGYIGQQIFGPNLIIITMIMAIFMAISITSSEESDGRLQTLLSLPLGRSKIFWQKWLAYLSVVGFTSLTILIGLYFGLLVADKTADWARVFESALAAWLLNLAYGMIAFAVAMATGKKGLTILLASGYTFVSFLISSLAQSIDKLELFDKFSIYHYYNNPTIMQDGLNWMHLGIMAVAIITMALVGWIIFLRRDVRA